MLAPDPFKEIFMMNRWLLSIPGCFEPSKLLRFVWILQCCR